MHSLRAGFITSAAERGHRAEHIADHTGHRSHYGSWCLSRAPFPCDGLTEQGISALQFQKDAGPGSYQTAWTLLHKLRSGLFPRAPDRLTGAVEADETYIGGYQPATADGGWARPASPSRWSGEGRPRARSAWRSSRAPRRRS